MICSVSCQHFRLRWDRCAAYYNVCAWVIGLRFTTNSLLWLPAEISYYGEFKERSFGIATKPVIFRSDVKRTHGAAITQHHVHCHSLLNQKVFFIFRYPLPSIFNPFPTIYFCSVGSICIPRQSQSSCPSHSPWYPYPAEKRDCDI